MRPTPLLALALSLSACPPPELAVAQRPGELGNLLFVDDLGGDPEGPLLLGALVELSVPEAEFGPLVPRSTDGTGLEIVRSESCGIALAPGAKDLEERVPGWEPGDPRPCDALVSLRAVAEGGAFVELLDVDSELVDRVFFDVRQADGARFASVELPSWPGVEAGGEILASNGATLDLSARLTSEGETLRHRAGLSMRAGGAELFSTSLAPSAARAAATMGGEDQRLEVDTPVGGLTFGADLVAVPDSAVTDVRVRVDAVDDSDPRGRCFDLEGYARRDTAPVLGAELAWTSSLPVHLGAREGARVRACEDAGAFDFVRLQGAWTGGPVHVRHLDARPGRTITPDAPVGVDEPETPGSGCSFGGSPRSLWALVLLAAFRRRPGSCGRSSGRATSRRTR